MLRKILFITAGLLIFAVCFTLSVRVRDYFYARHLEQNIEKVKVGMTGKQVVEILGEPSDRQMSDIPGTYWCYNTSTYDRFIYADSGTLCEQLLIEMGSNNIVVKTFEYRE